MRRSRELCALWGILVVAVLAIPLVPSGQHVATSAPPLPGPGSSLTGVPNPMALSPSPGTSGEVAPGFSPPAGVAVVGPVPPDLTMTVAVGLALPDPSALAGLLSALYAPGTPEYRHFRTSLGLVEEFGPAESTVSAAQAYFAGYGLFAVPSPDHLFLTVSGPSDRIAAAFATSFEEYRAPGGRVFFSHPTPATLPSTFAWTGAYGLGNATPLVPEEVGPLGVRAGVAPSAGCAGSASGLTPCQVWQAYNLSTLLAAGTNGSGERLAVVDAYSSAESQSNLTADLATFAGENGIPVGAVNYVYPVPASGNLNSSTNPTWALEDALDLEWARASAPGATVDMTFSPNAGVGLYQAVDWIVAHQAANVISMSWGEPDVGTFNAYDTPCSAACNASSDGSYGILSPVLEFAAAEGISVFAASGDCGASDGTSGLATNFPASDPDVTGVGGTVLSVDSAGNYLSEVAWSGNSTGAHSPGCVNQGGSGGGYSPFPRPVWQTGLPTGTLYRGVPDVALDAGTPAIVVKGGATFPVGGTSLATPVWAGIASVADQYAGQSLGLLNPTLYAIASGPNYSRDFHDILSGSNGYPAGPGWDPVTGLGSPQVASLVVDLAHPASVSSSNLTVFVYASPRFGRAPLSVSFHLNATGGTGSYPLEGVYFGNGNASFARNGSATYTFVTPGVYSVQAYVADSAANDSVSPPVAVVVGGGSALSVNLTASSESPARGAAVAFSVHVTGGVGPYRYNFSFGDGTFLDGSSQATTNHTYGAAGSFCAAVVVADSASPVNGGASARVAIGVGGAARPDCENDTVPLWILPNADLRGEDAPADFPFLFSVGGGSTVASTLGPSLQYSSTDPYVAACGCAIFRSPGTYEVTGYGNDSENQQVNTSVVVTVAPPLVGNFTASPTFGTAPLTVDFRASATGGEGANATSTNWTFGDGHSAVGASVVETYTTPGFYVAVGHLSDRGDGNASEAFLIDVEPTGGTSLPLPPFLVATVSPAVDVPTGAPVNFTARLLSASGADVPALFEWHFGSVSALLGYGAYRSSMTWTLNGPGFPPNGTLEATVSATVLSSGERVEAPLSLPSFDAVIPFLGGADFYPRVDALAFEAGAVGNTVLVGSPWVATGSVSGPGSVSVVWAFGDGGEESSLSANHTFSNGLYTVVVIAQDSWGDRATIAFPVEAWSIPILTASLSPTAGSLPLTVAFTSSVTGGVGPPYRFHWTFESGPNSSAPNGTHTFDADGTYRVVLTVGDLVGLGATMNWTVTVRPAPSGFPALVFLGVGAAVGTGTALAVLVPGRRARGSRPNP